MGDDKFVSRVIIGIIGALTAILGILLYVMYSDVKNTENIDAKSLPIKTIKIWTIHGGIETILNEVAREYESKHEGIKIEITTFKNEVYQSTIQNAAITNELPDIYFFWGYEKLKKYVDLDLVWNISEAMRKYYDGEPPLPGAMDGVTYDGEIYGMPINGWSSTLFCNSELFKKHNLAYPTTYNEFIEVIEKFKEKGVVPISSSAKEMWMNSLYYMDLVLEEGSVQGVYAASKDRSLFKTEQFHKAAKNMERLIATQPWEDNYLENDAYDAAYLFTQGKSAMLLSGSWSASIIEGEESKVKDKVDVITFPGLPDSVGVGGYADALVVSKQSQIAVDEELQKLYFDIIKEVSRKAIETDGIGLPAYENQIINQEKFPTLYKCAQVAPTKAIHPAYDQIFDEDLSDVYYDLLEQLMNRKINADEFIEGLSQ